jgi:serine/threonine-protein kinase
MDLRPGLVLRDALRLIRPLGEGAMGVVWVAEHLRLRTQVAVKFIHSELAAEDRDMVERFTREATAAAQIKSPHVVQTFDLGVLDDGTPFIVMELMEGESLRDRLMLYGRIDLLTCAEIVAQVARALGKAHGRAIVHRDIKPDNIFLVNEDDRLFAKVLDFGIAKQTNLRETGNLTMPGKMVGTPAYMSREQVMASSHVDHQADLWALAVVAYESLTGKVPFDGESMGEVCVAIVRGEYNPPSELRPELGPEVDAFFARAFHLNPDKRFPSAREMALELLGGATRGRVTSGALEDALDHSGRFAVPSAPGSRPSAPDAAHGGDRMRQVSTLPSLIADAAVPAKIDSQVVNAPPVVMHAGQPVVPSTGSTVEHIVVERRWPRAAVATVASLILIVAVLAAAMVARNGADEPVTNAAATPSVPAELPNGQPSEEPARATAEDGAEPLRTAEVEINEDAPAPSASAAAAGAPGGTAPGAKPGTKVPARPPVYRRPPSAADVLGL